jgi:hypothetical protein
MATLCGMPTEKYYPTILFLPKKKTLKIQGELLFTLGKRKHKIRKLKNTPIVSRFD